MLFFILHEINNLNNNYEITIHLVCYQHDISNDNHDIIKWQMNLWSYSYRGMYFVQNASLAAALPLPAHTAHT